MMRKKPELLSPAGDMEKLKMAVANGADAGYLAGTTIGMRSFEPSEEEDWHKFNEMLHAFDEAMPEGLRLGDFLDAPEIPTSEVRLGDKVWMREYESGYELFEVVGSGADDAPRGLVGAPFVNRYEHDGDYSWNGNNYIDSDTCRIAPRE